MLIRPLLKKPVIQIGLGFVGVRTAMAASTASEFIVPGGEENPKKASTIYNFRAKDIDGNMVDLSKYQGHVSIVSMISR